jgi:hypothetical protein
LQSVPLDEIIPLAAIPGHPETSQVEISKEIWPVVRTIVHTVTIAVESGASPVADLFPGNYPAAVDQPVLFLFIYIRVTGLGGLGARLYDNLSC